MNQSEFLRALLRAWLRSCPGTFAVIAFSLATAISTAQTANKLKPIAAWSFAQAVGNFVPDASSNGYDAIIYGQPVPGARWGKYVALAFDGSGDNSFWRG